MKVLSKSLLAVITISTASVYYAQSTQEAPSKETEIEEVILTGVTDIAKDRKTPVAVSTIKAAQIIERLGNQELPEILNTTPSVYATKSGGGFGDGGITMRGFESRNIAVMVNGMPVNDMEGGSVYFSNWTGLSDVTSTLQVQRGLGSSKLAIASVGGTINFLTRSADMKQGGVIRLGVGNDDYLKASFAYNTGKSQDGWSSSILMSRQSGSTYVENTEYEAYAYYFALGFEPNKKHNFQLTLTSAPQWHDQRSYATSINDNTRFNGGNINRRYNSDFGYYTNSEGKRVAMANRANYYAKPVMMLNWDWTMSEKSKLSTVLYASNGRGGGTGDLGRINGKTSINDESLKDAQGHYDYDKIFAGNAAINPETAGNGATLVRRSSINSHNWYGILANFNHKLNDNWNFSVGTDNRYYYGYHYQVITDLYGATGYKNGNNKNIAPAVVSRTFDYKNLSWNPFGGKTADLRDQVGYSNDGEVLWYSGFGQLEYSKNNLSAFVQGSVSNQSYQRIDHFVAADGSTVQQGQNVNKKTGFKDLFGYNIKGGANYNIDANHNVFANIGYYSKQPFMNAVYPSNQQVVNPALTNEKIFSTEIGYGFRSAKFNANVNLYRTEWKDRWQRRSMDFDVVDPNSPTGVTSVRGFAEINGITQVHMGAEFDATYKATDWLEFQGMVSYGDYQYKGNATGTTFDENNNPISATGESTNKATLYLDGVKVGGSGSNSIPQFTASLGATVKPVKDLAVYGTWRYTGELYSSISIDTFSNQANQERGVLQLPDFNVLDLGANYKIRLKNTTNYFSIGANVYNVFDTTYIADGATNIMDDTDRGYTGVSYKGIDTGNRVYFGFGRTWSANLAFNF